MLRRAYSVFLIINIFYNKSASCFDSFYAVRTNDYPKSSCHKIANIETAGKCLLTCKFSVETIIMISHDISAKICMCCNDITGSDISGSNWKTFIEPHCADGYAPYNLLGSQICLKYFPVPVFYATAKANCEAEGGNLIKIDSQEKYDIFNDYHVSVANNTVIQVWVQGEKIEGQWKFDDGTLIPEYCRFSMSNGPIEVHMRAFGSTSFACADNPNSSPFNYSCEYPSLTSIQN